MVDQCEDAGSLVLLVHYRIMLIPDVPFAFLQPNKRGWAHAFS